MYVAAIVYLCFVLGRYRPLSLKGLHGSPSLPLLTDSRVSIIGPLAYTERDDDLDNDDILLVKDDVLKQAAVRAKGEHSDDSGRAASVVSIIPDVVSSIDGTTVLISSETLKKQELSKGGLPPRHIHQHRSHSSSRSSSVITDDGMDHDVRDLIDETKDILEKAARYSQAQFDHDIAETETRTSSSIINIEKDSPVKALDLFTATLGGSGLGFLGGILLAIQSSSLSFDERLHLPLISAGLIGGLSSVISSQSTPSGTAVRNVLSDVTKTALRSVGEGIAMAGKGMGDEIQAMPSRWGEEWDQVKKDLLDSFNEGLQDMRRQLSPLVVKQALENKASGVTETLSQKLSSAMSSTTQKVASGHQLSKARTSIVKDLPHSVTETLTTALHGAKDTGTALLEGALHGAKDTGTALLENALHGAKDTGTALLEDLPPIIARKIQSSVQNAPQALQSSLVTRIQSQITALEEKESKLYKTIAKSNHAATAAQKMKTRSVDMKRVKEEALNKLRHLEHDRERALKQSKCDQQLMKKLYMAVDKRKEVEESIKAIDVVTTLAKDIIEKKTRMVKMTEKELEEVKRKKQLMHWMMRNKARTTDKTMEALLGEEGSDAAVAVVNDDYDKENQSKLVVNENDEHSITKMPMVLPSIFNFERIDKAIDNLFSSAAAERRNAISKMSDNTKEEEEGGDILQHQEQMKQRHHPLRRTPTQSIRAAPSTNNVKVGTTIALPKYPTTDTISLGRQNNNNEDKEEPQHSIKSLFGRTIGTAKPKKNDDNTQSPVDATVPSSGHDADKEIPKDKQQEVRQQHNVFSAATAAVTKPFEQRATITNQDNKKKNDLLKRGKTYFLEEVIKAKESKTIKESTNTNNNNNQKETTYRPTHSLENHNKNKPNERHRRRVNRYYKSSSTSTLPTLSNWVKNRDGSLTGHVTGSSSFEPNEKVTTSPLANRWMELKGGMVVQTCSGTRYYLAHLEKSQSPTSSSSSWW